MGEVIVITSGKGGVGKTTTTANIGIGLSGLGKKVLVIDTDLGLRNLDVVMGLENRIVYNLVDVINGNCRLKQALVRDKRFPELYLLPSAQTKDKSSVSPEQMKKLVDDLRDEYDFVLLDCPAGIEQGFQNAIAGAERSIVVTTPEVSAIRDADRIIGLLETSGIKKNQLLINRIRIDMVRRGDMMSVDDVTEILAIELLGVIPDDKQVVIATNQGEPVVGEGSQAGAAYDRVCRRLRFMIFHSRKVFSVKFPVSFTEIREAHYEFAFSICRKRAAEEPSCVRQDTVYSGCCGQTLKRSVLYSFKVHGSHTG